MQETTYVISCSECEEPRSHPLRKMKIRSEQITQHARTHTHARTDAHGRTRTNRRTHTHATSTLRNTQSNSYIEDIIRWRRDKDFIILENSILRVRRTDVLPTRRSDAMFFLIMWMGVFYSDQNQFLESTCHNIWDLTVTYLPYVTSLRN